MRTISFKTSVPATRKLEIQLPPNVPTGLAEVAVTVETPPGTPADVADLARDHGLSEHLGPLVQWAQGAFAEDADVGVELSDDPERPARTVIVIRVIANVDVDDAVERQFEFSDHLVENVPPELRQFFTFSVDGPPTL